MVIQVGINGFGRIGRIVCRTCLQNSDLQLSAINDPALNIEYICYLIKFDSTHGKLEGDITHTDNVIVIDGHHIKIFHEKLPPSVPWQSAGVQYVVEASGMFTNYEKASGHLESDGVKRVIVTAPSVDVPMIVLGVNDDKLDPAEKVISCASSTLYCLAPIIKVLEDSFGVTEGFITSIHAMTPSLKPLDGLCLRGRHWRDHRSIHQNIIPATTGACKALGKILPQVKDKLSGLAFRVPIVNVSVLDLTVRLNSNTTLQEIVKSMEEASKTTLRHIMRISSEDSVSSDFIGESHSCIFDQDTSIQLKPNFFKIICWYENEYSYACRVIDTILISEKQFSLDIPTKIMNSRQISLKKLNTVHHECFKKETSSICCRADIDSKIISSTSQDTGVSISKPPQHFYMNKKISSTSPLQTNKDTKRAELFEIWNDRCKNPKTTTQNKCSFFQSCICDLQPNKMGCNAQERLENVKREFSKMANITEDLMKKTFKSQSFVRSVSIDENKGFNDDHCNTKEVDITKDDTTHLKKCENISTGEETDHINTCIDLSKASKSQTRGKDETQPLAPYKKECALKSEYNGNGTKDSKEVLNATVLGKEANENNKNKDTLHTSKPYHIESFNEKCGRSSKNVELIHELNKPVNKLIDECSQNQQVQSDNIETVTSIEKVKETVAKLTTEFSLPYKDIVVPFEIKSSYEPAITEVEDGKDKLANIINKYKKRKKRAHIKMIDDELRKRNIVLVDIPIGSKSDSKLCKQDGAGLSSANKTDENINMIRTRITPDITLVPEDDLGCPSPENTVTTFSNAYESKQELYDKFDSVSESTSSNSFEMKERKSQVIQITDLTNSLEDLSRLDKICRIIEISDELSDKLFSALDNNRATELHNEKWSFKDFCMRIKLDEFCDRVFGGYDL